MFMNAIDNSTTWTNIIDVHAQGFKLKQDDILVQVQATYNNQHYTLLNYLKVLIHSHFHEQ